MSTTTLTAPSTDGSVAWGRAAGALALLGGTLGVACDAAHVHSGTTRYTSPTALGMVWWVVPLFATAGVCLGLGPIVVERLFGRNDPAPTIRAALAGLGLFVAAYVASCFVHGFRGVVVLLAIAAGIAAIVDRRPVGAIAALGAAVAGPAVEITFVRLGLFEHLDPGFLGIPLWLPALYVCASYGVSGVARAVALGR